MSLQAFKEKAREIVEQKIESKRQVEVNQNKAKALKGLPRILSLQEPCFLTPLHSEEDILDLEVHDVWKSVQNTKTVEHVICNKQYQKINPLEFAKCSTCEEDDDWGGKRRARSVKAFIAYAHNREGQEFATKKDPSKTFKVNPVSIVLLRQGENRANFLSLQEDIRMGAFKKEAVFKLERVGTGKETSYPPMKKLSREDVRDAFGEEFDVDSQEYLDAKEKYSKYTEDQIAEEILANCSNVLWDRLGLVDPALKTEVDDEEESSVEDKPKTGSGKSLKKVK